jgi:hypothetical protein
MNPRRLATAVAAATLALSLLGAPVHAVGTTHWVNDNDPNGFPYVPPGTNCNNPGYPNINAAVLAAMSGDTIVVCNGIYPENVSITESLKVIGETRTGARVTGVATTPGPIFDVSNPAVTVTIERLTVDGNSAQAGGISWGIRYDGTDGVIRNVSVVNIRDASGATQGQGIRIQSTLGPASVRIEDNLVQNFTRGGITGNFAGVSVNVRNNKVIGPVAPKVWAPNGIQISRGARASVVGNFVRNATSPNPPAGAGSGILLFCAGPTSAQANFVTDSDLGIAISDNQDAQVRGNVVRDSVFNAYDFGFLGNLFGPLGCPQTPSPTQDNLLKQNLAVSSGEFGISLSSSDPTLPAPPTMNDIVGNVIRVSGVDGIRVFDGTDNSFIGNSIRFSDEHDCHDDTIGTRTAGTANTWKDNDGTTSYPPGLCDARDHHDDDDDDFDDDGDDNGHDEDDDNDGKHDDDDDDDDNDGEHDSVDVDDDNDGLTDAVDDVEVFTADSLLKLSIPSTIEALKVSPH